MASRPEITNSSPTGDDASNRLALLGSRLNQLSIEERDDRLHDLHGVAHEIEENPTMIKSKLQEMTFALLSLIAEIGSEESLGHGKAVSFSPKHVEGKKLVFLRAESFRIQEACQRMMRFFSSKLELFGEKRLTREITWKDLDEDTQEMVQKGLAQLLPERDRAGRPVFFLRGRLSGEFEDAANMQAIFCFVMAVSQDEDIQKKGMVAICYAIGQERAIHGRVIKLIRLAKSLPWRLVGQHMVREDNWRFAAPVQMLIKLAESRHLGRTRFHTGTPMECACNLMTFGIPRDALPISADGHIDLSSHQKTLDCLQENEERREQFAANGCDDKKTLVPGPMDVLMGRGQQPTSRPGLLRMHQLLAECQESCEAQSRTQKLNVAKMVLEDMKNFGCRFLIATKDGAHEECDDKTALKQISHGFCNMRGKTKMEDCDGPDELGSSNKKRARNETFGQRKLAAVQDWQ